MKQWENDITLRWDLQFYWSAAGVKMEKKKRFNIPYITFNVFLFFIWYQLFLNFLVQVIKRTISCTLAYYLDFIFYTEYYT